MVEEVVLRYCPMCDRSYPDWEALRTHLKKSQAAGDENHIDIIILEDWEAFVASNETVPKE